MIIWLQNVIGDHSDLQIIQIIQSKVKAVLCLFFAMCLLLDMLCKCFLMQIAGFVKTNKLMS